MKKMYQTPTAETLCIVKEALLESSPTKIIVEQDETTGITYGGVDQNGQVVPDVKGESPFAFDWEE